MVWHFISQDDWIRVGITLGITLVASVIVRYMLERLRRLSSRHTWLQTFSETLNSSAFWLVWLVGIGYTIGIFIRGSCEAETYNLFQRVQRSLFVTIALWLFLKWKKKVGTALLAKSKICKSKFYDQELITVGSKVCTIFILVIAGFMTLEIFAVPIEWVRVGVTLGITLLASVIVKYIFERLRRLSPRYMWLQTFGETLDSSAFWLVWLVGIGYMIGIFLCVGCDVETYSFFQQVQRFLFVAIALWFFLKWKKKVGTALLAKSKICKSKFYDQELITVGSKVCTIFILIIAGFMTLEIFAVPIEWVRVGVTLGITLLASVIVKYIFERLRRLSPRYMWLQTFGETLDSSAFWLVWLVGIGYMIGIFLCVGCNVETYSFFQQVQCFLFVAIALWLFLKWKKKVGTALLAKSKICKSKFYDQELITVGSKVCTIFILIIAGFMTLEIFAAPIEWVRVGVTLGITLLASVIVKYIFERLRRLSPRYMWLQTFGETLDSSAFWLVWLVGIGYMIGIFLCVGCNVETYSFFQQVQCFLFVAIALWLFLKWKKKVEPALLAKSKTCKSKFYDQELIMVGSKVCTIFAIFIAGFMTFDIFAVPIEWVRVGVTLGVTLVASVVIRYTLERLRRLSPRYMWLQTFGETLDSSAFWLVWLVGIGYMISSFLCGGCDAETYSLFQRAQNLLFVAIALWLFLKWKKKVEKSLLIKSKNSKTAVNDQALITVGSKVCTISAIVVAGFMTLDIFTVPIQTLLAFGGVGSLAISWAAKDVIANFFGGMMIFINHPFIVGDWIKSPNKGFEGVVEELGWYMTRIRNFERRPTYIPNSLLTDAIVENPGRMYNRRIRATIGLRYEDIGKVEAITEGIRAMLMAHEHIDQDQLLFVNFVQFNSHSLDIDVYCFTKTTRWGQFRAVQQDVLLKIAAIVEKEGAQIAFPTHTVYVEKECST